MCAPGGQAPVPGDLAGLWCAGDGLSLSWSTLMPGAACARDGAAPTAGPCEPLARARVVTPRRKRRGTPLAIKWHGRPPGVL